MGSAGRARRGRICGCGCGSVTANPGGAGSSEKGHTN